MDKCTINLYEIAPSHSTKKKVEERTLVSCRLFGTTANFILLKVEPRAHLHHTYCPFMFSASSATHLPYLIFLSSSADANEVPVLGVNHLLRGLGASRRGNIQLSRGTTVLPLVAALILLTLPVSSGSTSSHVARC